MSKIDIVPYNPLWPAEFAQIRLQLAAALGPLALRIDHIGSTSVPGLDAKDIIDIQVTVADFDPPLEERMLAAGFARARWTEDHRPPGDSHPDWHWQKLLFHEAEGQRMMNIHIRALGRSNQRYALLFRDYLREHPPAAAAYAELKRRLADYIGEDRLAYTTIKDPACDLILFAAEDWAARTHWSPGES